MSCTVVVKLKVENYEAWKSHYDAGEPVRREFHVRAVGVLRDASDPNTVFVLTRFDSVDDAKKMLAAPKWQETAKKAGASSMETWFTNVAQDKTY